MKKRILVYGEDARIASRVEHCIYEMEVNANVLVENTIRGACYNAVLNQIDVFVVPISTNSKHSGKVLRILRKVKEIEEYKFTPIIVICNMENIQQTIFNELHCFACFDSEYDKEAFEQSVKAALCYERVIRKSTLYRYGNNVLYSIQEDKIKYIEVKGKAIFVTSDKDEVMKFGYSTCKELLDELNSEHFFQASRNIIVNDIYIENIDFTNRVIRLVDKKTLPIGPAYIKAIKQMYKELGDKQKSTKIRRRGYL